MKKSNIKLYTADQKSRPLDIPDSQVRSFFESYDWSKENTLYQKVTDNTVEFSPPTINFYSKLNTLVLGISPVDEHTFEIYYFHNSLKGKTKEEAAQFIDYYLNNNQEKIEQIFPHAKAKYLFLSITPWAIVFIIFASILWVSIDDSLIVRLQSGEVYDAIETLKINSSILIEGKNSYVYITHPGEYYILFPFTDNQASYESIIRGKFENLSYNHGIIDLSDQDYDIIGFYPKDHKQIKEILEILFNTLNDHQESYYVQESLRYAISES